MAVDHFKLIADFAYEFANRPSGAEATHLYTGNEEAGLAARSVVDANPCAGKIIRAVTGEREEGAFDNLASHPKRETHVQILCSRLRAGAKRSGQG